MLAVPEEIRHRLRSHRQEHVLAAWDRLTGPQRAELLSQIEVIDFDQLDRLYAQRDRLFAPPTPDRIAPLPVVRLGEPDLAIRQLGEECLRRGETAVLVVAGGQGTRLGFDRPKGTWPVGPVSEKSLFQVHAEKVRALTRSYGRPIPLLVMTSPATDAVTRAFFEEHRSFGLPDQEVFFFCQGTMPALDLETGRLLLEKPYRLCLSPDGHGGTLTALADSGLLDELRQRGIRQLFYFQVDNPLVKVADPVYLGQHLRARAEVSSKVIPKLGPTDKLGNLVLIDGRCGMIEYSDLPEELGRQTDAKGELRIWAGNPAIHIFAVDFLTRVLQTGAGLPFHVARKKVPCLDASGRLVEPERENALKFERFIFDVLPLAERWTVVETSRDEEFAPLKNASGPDSPDTVRQAMTNLAARWLEQAGVAVPRRPDGTVAVALEIGPLFALDAAEAARKLDRRLRIDGPLCLDEP